MITANNTISNLDALTRSRITHEHKKLAAKFNTEILVKAPNLYIEVPNSDKDKVIEHIDSSMYLTKSYKTTTLSEDGRSTIFIFTT